MNILGIGTLAGSSAVALLIDGRLTAALEEAKIARRTRPGELPVEAVRACLEIGKLTAGDVDVVAFVRPIEAAAGAALHLELRELFPAARLALVDHHLAHACSAFYPSPFDEATVLTLDRRGDLRCGARWSADARGISMEADFYYPDSLADLYTRVTDLLGFVPDAEEHKTQWLSASGQPTYLDLFREIIGSGEPSRFDRSYFDPGRLTRGGFSSKFFRALGVDDDANLSPETRSAVAASLQTAVEEQVVALAGTGKNLCLAGGLAFNAFLVSALERSGKFDNVFVQPAAGNAGTALGAVAHIWCAKLGNRGPIDTASYLLGPEYSAEEIKQVLENCKLRFRYLLTDGELVDTAVEQLSDHKIVAWMQGRMEFGPRALGNRSILASPLDPYSTENLNLFIKRREDFRKFAASVPEEVAGEYFEVTPNARHLASVSRVRAAHRSTFEAAILGHDFVRVQTVRREANPLFWSLLHAAGRRTGLPVLYNTSFNLFGEPLVCSPRDAVRSFYASGIDAMFVGNFFLAK